MPDKFPERGNFSIPSSLIDEHEWMADSLIDDLGKVCTILYPYKDVECPNCFLDPRTKRSNSIFKSSGPKPFTNFTQCPWCYGEGHLETRAEGSVTLRLYWDPKDWVGGITVENPTGVVQSIGYMSDLNDVEQADKILLNDSQAGIKRWECERMGEAQPWGFRANRYFIQMWERVSGG